MCEKSCPLLMNIGLCCSVRIYETSVSNLDIIAIIWRASTIFGDTVNATSFLHNVMYNIENTFNNWHPFYGKKPFL